MADPPAPEEPTPALAPMPAAAPPPVGYKVTDQRYSPSDPAATENFLTSLGQQGNRLSVVYPDSQRGKTRWVFTTGAAASPVPYKVVDLPWSPSEPSVTETLLNQLGQAGWQLVIAYPDPRRERTRWIFSQGASGSATGGLTGPNFDPGAISSSLTLTDGVTVSIGSTTAHGYQCAYSASRHSSGRFFIKTTIDFNDGLGYYYTFVGFANPPPIPNAGVGSDTNSIGVWDDGSIFFNTSTGSGSIGAAWSTGDVIDQILDLDSRKYWARKSTGNWNNDVIANQDPFHNIGGIDISSMVGPISYVVGFDVLDPTAVNKVTADFSSGLTPFLAWDLGGAAVETMPMTVVSLPPAGHRGRRMFVTDATAPTYGAAVTGGGAVPTPVYDDGATWRVG